MKLKPKVRKPNQVGFKERLASLKPSQSRTCLRWSPTGRIFDLKGKIIASSKSECQSDIFVGCSKHMIGHLKLLINFVWKFLGTFHFGNDHITTILGYCDLQWRNILITKVYFVEGLGHNLFSVEQFCDSECFQKEHLSNDEAPQEIKIFLKKITILLQALVINVRTNNGTKFKNQVLQEYFNSAGISHRASFVRTPHQNRVVERKNQTLMDAARTMLIFSRALLFLWAEAIATVCYTENYSIIHHRFDKTPYELINCRKMDISFLHVFGALCYPKNDREDIGKLGTIGDIGFFIGYSTNFCSYRVYN
nr:integrase, catalytic region, zinc finger, CCHC-type, peptidase aspartic, catalytic [Tanacetum cinerariifolium]